MMLYIQKKKRRKRWKRYKYLQRLQINFSKPRDYEKLKRYFNKSNTTHFYPSPLLELAENMDFAEHIVSMVEFTKNVHAISKLTTKRLQINHKKVKNVSVAALLYIVAQIDYIVNLKFGKNENRLKYNKRLGIDNHNDKLKFLFHQIGYWRYFGINKPYKISSSIKDILFLRIHTNTKDNFEYLNAIKQFIKQKVHLFDNYELEYKFDDAVKEALGNTLEHAYPHDFELPGKTKNKWWICGFYDKKNKFLEIIFYDYGVGIRESIKRNLDQKADRGLLDKIIDGIVHDGKLLEIALTAQLSKYKRYDERDRGKGFKRFKDFAEALGYNCKLIVISGNGLVNVTYEKMEEPINVYKLPGKLDGMLIKWQIKIGDNNGNDTL